MGSLGDRFVEAGRNLRWMHSIQGTKGSMKRPQALRWSSNCLKAPTIAVKLENRKQRQLMQTSPRKPKNNFLSQGGLLRANDLQKGESWFDRADYENQRFCFRHSLSKNDQNRSLTRSTDSMWTGTILSEEALASIAFMGLRHSSPVGLHEWERGREPSQPQDRSHWQRMLLPDVESSVESKMLMSLIC